MKHSHFEHQLILCCREFICCFYNCVEDNVWKRKIWRGKDYDKDMCLT